VGEKEMGTGNDILSEIRRELVAGDQQALMAAVRKFLDQRADPLQILQEALMPGMSEVGEKMAKKELFIPEVLASALAMKEALEMIRPLLAKGEITSKGTVLLGTVKGDIHDIGKNLVAYMLEGSGYRVVDIGISVTPEKFVEAIKQHTPEIVGMSAMLTTTMQEMGTTIRVLKEHGVRDAVRVIVGGAPVNRSFAVEIGADGYADDAGGAVGEIEKLMSAR
jgi:5-methyltetrahydrofolate--homocysteine methyltransferase